MLGDVTEQRRSAAANRMRAIVSVAQGRGINYAVPALSQRGGC